MLSLRSLAELWIMLRLVDLGFLLWRLRLRRAGDWCIAKAGDIAYG